MTTLRARTVQAGFTLVELMISMTLSLMVLVALVGMFVNISRSGTEMAKTNALIENGRFAVQLLEQDLVHAGYWGGYLPQFDDLSTTVAPTDAPTGVPDPCQDPATWTAADLNNLKGIAVQSFETLPAGAGCLLPLPQRAGTDVVVVRHVELCLPGVGNCEAEVAGQLYLQVSSCDLEKADPTLRYKLDTANFTLHKRNCVGTGSPAVLPITGGDIADKRRWISNIYYITDLVHPDRPAEVVPALVRSRFDLASGALAHQAPEVLIDGIEAFRVELGIDDRNDLGNLVDYATAYIAPVEWANPDLQTSPINRGDGTVDQFVRCTDAVPCTVAELANVVAVKFYVLSRSRDRTPGYTDNKTYCLGEPNADGSCPVENEIAAANDDYKRHVFTTSVRLVNVSGRRETPP